VQRVDRLARLSTVREGPRGAPIIRSYPPIFKRKSATAGLYTIRPDGTRRKRLTHMAAKRFATNPDWGIAP
jgi:hypothetical protein